MFRSTRNIKTNLNDGVDSFSNRFRVLSRLVVLRTRKRLEGFGVVAVAVAKRSQK